MTLRAIIWAAVSTASQANEEEKYSLPSQEADARALCEKEGWTIVDALIVPGHSRNYRSLDKLAADASAKGIDAFARLKAHLEACDFDVLICRDANRFARTAALLHFIVESIIEDCGARIYSFNDGWVDAQNADMFAMVKGFQTTKEMKWLKESARRGKDKLVERGLPIGAHVPMSHRRIRDPISGKDIGIELNPSAMPLMRDLAELLLEGVAWNRLGHEMYERFGYTDQTGKPYSSTTFYYLIYNPYIWGHSGRRHTQTGKFGPWIFDESCDPPPDIKIARNTVPAVYTGELAERLKAELYRRMDIRGRARPSRTSRFSGLFICGECGRTMVVRAREGGQRIGLKCPTIDTMRSHFDRQGRVCHQNLMTPNRYLHAYINDMLETFLRGETPAIFHINNQLADLNTSLEQTKSAIANIESQVDRLITEQALAPFNVQPVYRRQIESLSKQLEVHSKRASELEWQLKQEQQAHDVQWRTTEEVREIGLERFWELPETQINQTLKRLFGTRRLVLMGRQVIKAVNKERL